MDFKKEIMDFKINESPDRIKELGLIFNDEDAIAFGFVNTNCYVGVSERYIKRKYGDAFFSKYQYPQIHSMIGDFYSIVLDDDSLVGENFDMTVNRTSMKFPGRL